MKGRKYQGIKPFTENLGRFQGKKHKSLVSKALRGNEKIKYNKFVVAHDPATNQAVIGTAKEVADKLKVGVGTITNRFKKGAKSEFGNVNGFIITRHKDIDASVNFRNEMKKEDKYILKNSPIIDGVEYLKLLKPNYNLSIKEKAEVKKFGTKEIRYTLQLSDELTLDDIAQIFTDSIKNATKGLDKRDKIRIIIFDASLSSGAISAYGSVGDITALDIMNAIEKAIESNEEFSLSDETEIMITTVSPPKEFLLIEEKKKKNKKKYQGIKNPDSGGPVVDEDTCGICITPPAETHKINPSFKKSMVTIKNTDSLCVPRAIATGFYMAIEGMKSKNYDNCKRGRPIQLEKANELVKEYEKLTNTIYDDEGFGIESLKVFEKITGCNITAIDGDQMLDVVYPILKKGEDYWQPPDTHKSIYLYLSTNDDKPHCDLIHNKRVAGFFGKGFFCHWCKKTYTKKDCHSCQFKCNMCCKIGCPTRDEDKDKILYNIKCDNCFRNFSNDTCYENHLGRVCSDIWKCQECKKVMKRSLYPLETHLCGDYYCDNCKQVVHEDHLCYMMPKRVNDPSEKYVFFDFEADISGETHEVNYSVSMKFDDATPIIHKNIDEFCEWAFSKINKGYTFIAHNGKGYDYRFIIKWIFKNTTYKPFVIWAGEKIMTMSIQECKVRFIDSMSFISGGLAQMPKTFGIKNIKKGFFPHWFNTKKNWDYEEGMPPRNEFKAERFFGDGFNEFDLWYKTQLGYVFVFEKDEKGKDKPYVVDDKNCGKWVVDENGEEKIVNTPYVWNQQAELKAYCISDVDILRKCCMAFREIYLEIANIDPFTYLTIASVCMAIYKHEFVDTTFARRTENIDKMRAVFGEPRLLKGKKLEIWNDVQKQYKKETLDNVFSEKRIGIFKYEDVEWMRQAFFGGRTNAVKLIYNFKENEEGIYSDITSLYPTVNYYDIYPKGHPIIFTEDQIDDEDYKRVYNKEILGFIDCEISAPKDLYHPVLPMKGDKLIFDLNDKRGVWCSNEIYVALDMGYTIKKIYEIRHFREGTKDLFKGYVSKFLKIKQECNDYPPWVFKPELVNIPDTEIYGFELEDYLNITEDQRKDLYIQQYETHQGILLDKTKITKNTGMRATAKLCLNSLWGKFGQRTNMGRCEIIDDPAEWFEILYNEKYDNVVYEHLGEGKIQMSYTFKDEFVKNDYNTNMAIATFTTSRARMRLYEEALVKLDRQVLYFDTDSVVYKYDKTNPDDLILKNGDLLGDWTNELKNNQKMVGSFVSGGPKNYSYELEETQSDGSIKMKTKTKVKGISLNKETSDKINHHSIKELIEGTLFSRDCDGNKIIADWHGIKRGKGNTLENVSMKKRYGLCYTKRQTLEEDEFGNYDTHPFGFDDGSEYKYLHF
tara:strand:- start:3333 stop:7490 length:4158 start_codon:yes stop_codon:yes gene_type:complete